MYLTAEPPVLQQRVTITAKHHTLDDVSRLLRHALEPYLNQADRESMMFHAGSTSNRSYEIDNADATHCVTIELSQTSRSSFTVLFANNAINKRSVDANEARKFLFGLIARLNEHIEQLSCDERQHIA